MLTTLEEDRLEAALPSTVTVTYEGVDYDYDLHPHWSGSDAAGDDAGETGEHPAIVFSYDIQGQPDDERQPADGVRKIEPNGQNDYVETRTERVWDDLSITIAVEATHDDNGVPPQVRRTQLTRRIWRYCLFELDINSTGANGERPLVVDVINSPTPSRVERTFRSTFAIRLRHTEDHEVTQETVESADYDVSSQ